ncbi:kinase-like domain-containing protein, partial [Alternaria rosae]|uniref:kinase-like domain-containing protein n=1 Tax=Alternaria rosae TaxID=1187941 RepID=UPI001E8DBC85
HVFKHVACGLDFLHSRGVVHGDTKPANILLTAAREGDRFSLHKIAYFGAASRGCSSNIPRGHLGTPSFQPPETDYRHEPGSDIWALGCMIPELILGRLPVQKIEELDTDEKAWFEESGAGHTV